MSVTYHLGDTRDVTATIPDGSVSLVATSPPFLALRSYLPSDHPLKDAEIGSEPDPATFLDTLLALTAEWGRVLAPWGSIAIELGDTYTGAGGYGSPDSLNPAFSGPKRDQHFEGRTARRFKTKDDGWPLAKSLALIPQLYAIALAYGINPLTGQPSPAGRWRVRNVIVWHRPNPAVGGLGDKVRPSTSYIVVATRSDKRWFDLTAVRSPSDLRPTGGGNMDPGNQRDDDWRRGKKPEGGGVANPAGAPPLDCWFDTWDGSHDTWTVTTQPSRLSHYAMWPAKLAERLILSMCPAEVCRECGTPRRRVEKADDAVREANRAMTGFATRDGREAGGVPYSFRSPALTTLGWTDCGCGTGWTPGVVLDPFAGTFTTGCVAEFHGRDAIGIDIDSRNRDLWPMRKAEVFKSLNPTHVKVLDGQMDLFGGVA